MLFQVIPVKIYGPNGFIESYAMFDSGADVSVIDETITHKLGIDGPSQVMDVKWIDSNTKRLRCKIADIRISGAFKNAPIFKLHDIRITKGISLPIQSLNVEELASRYNYINDYPVCSYQNAHPKILLSLKEYTLSLCSRPPVYINSGPIVTQTKLGWMVYGTTQGKVEASTRRICTLREDKEELANLDAKVRRFINSDDFGCGDSKKLLCEDDKRCFEILDKTTAKIDNRFESGLLWKKDDTKLPDNYKTALLRFNTIERKMESDAQYRETYISKIEEYISKGYAIEMTASESEKKNDRTWYLPHFGVTNKNKPGKLRLVFDAASKTSGSSLNNHLLSGPDLNQPLISVLFKFRERKVGVCGDIKEMFHQIKIIKEDQDSQRFLFRGHKNDPIKTYKMQVMTFGATCSPTTAQYVKNKNAENFRNDFPKAASAICYNHYVDDYVCSFDDELEAIEVTKQVVNIHANAGFILRGFISNSVKVAQTLNSYQTTDAMNMDIGNTNPKILGLFWNLSTDRFTFKTNMDRINSNLLQFKRSPTKRELLSIVMSLFDPFGFAANYTINGKLLLQSIWKEGIGWDTQISGDLEQVWRNWLKQLPNVENITIPRCYSESLFTSHVQLHVFVDASSQAFAAVAYYRVVCGNKVTVSFVCSKTKCSPLKYISIPRLELQAAVLGVRLAKSILQNQTVNVNETYYWSDSTTVLFWIRNEKRQFKQFVANRIAEILESSKSENWFKVSSKANIADRGTRASTDYSEVFGNNDWINGPQWLTDGDWPTQITENPSSELELEVKTCQIVHETQNHEHQHFLINFNRFSSYTKLVRTVAWVFRFIENISLKVRNKSFLSSKEMQKAELFICKDVQKDYYKKEYTFLKEFKSIEKSSSIYSLHPYLDETDVMRVNGRIDNAPTIPIQTKRPIIMPKDHYVSSLIVKNAHRICCHHFQEAIICETRKKFWINDLRSLVRKTKLDCNECKIANAKPISPLMGPHPVDRLTPFIRPFTYTGVDYFGPVQISIGRRREKRWIAIFTCLTVRAVHTEIVENLSSDACIMCIKNFVNIRGVPKRMRSDNGTCFVGINNEIMKADHIFQQKAVQDELAIRQIEWKFNLPSNPSAGGCWEIMVKLVKRILKQTMKDTAPRTETLRCVLLEACNIINSRPLTHIPTSTLEEEPLTPNHFLIGENNAIQQFSNEEEHLWTLRKQWRIANAMKNNFWKRFVKEYIPTLNRRSKNCSDKIPLKPGDIVLIADDNLQRNAWPRGLVLETFPGKDGVVRGVLLKTLLKEIRRPVCRLAVIGHSDMERDIERNTIAEEDEEI